RARLRGARARPWRGAPQVSGQPATEPAPSELEQARRLLSATAIRALGEDVWRRWRPWLDAPLVLAIGVTLIWLLAPGGLDGPHVPAADSIARVAVRAAHDINVEERARTEARRAAAAAEVKPLFQYDSDYYVGLIDKVHAAVKA